jgi:hypothetical protein
MTWNPHYTAYAKEHGRTEQEQLDHDRAEMPGASMGPFMSWINQRRAAFIAQGGELTRGGGVKDRNAWSAFVSGDA